MILIAHFYNEEYLLPFWLEHHKKIFDKAILINSFSTDKSLEIINKIAPDWDVVNSADKKFNSESMEKFIIDIENNYQDEVKIVLNISEFLIIKKFKKFKKLISQKNSAFWIQAAMMVDLENHEEEVVDLLKQKNTGFWHSDKNLYKINKKFTYADSNYRERLIHNFDNGMYLPGRHKSKLKNTKRMSRNIAYICWYNFSPWNKRFIERKLSFANTLSTNDKEKKHGFQHLADYDDLDKMYKYYTTISYNLRGLTIKSFILSMYNLKLYPFTFFFKKTFNKLKSNKNLN